jgi:hypothetical protein
MYMLFVTDQEILMRVMFVFILILVFTRFYRRRR